MKPRVEYPALLQLRSVMKVKAIARVIGVRPAYLYEQRRLPPDAADRLGELRDKVRKIGLVP